MRRPYALAISVLVWIGLIALLWATLLGVNLGAVCGRVLAPWAYLAEAVAFLPTIWLTRPLDQWLETKRAGIAITIGSIVETIFLATLYSTFLYLLLRRTLIDTSRRFFARFKWPLAGLVVALVASSAWLRAQLHASDYGRPLTHEAAKILVSIRTPQPAKAKIEMIARRSFPVESLEGRAIVAREGAQALVLAVRTSYIREPRLHTTNEYVLHRLTAERLEPLPPVPLAGEGRPLGEPRCAYGAASEVLLALEGSYGGAFYTMSLTAAAPSIVAGPPGLQSVQVLVAPEGTYSIGFGGRGGIRSNRLQRYPFDSRSAHGGDICILRTAGGTTEALGLVPSFGDHTLNNVAAVRTDEGTLHLLGTEVAIGHDNSSRVHYFRFDPKAIRWLGDDVLMVRAKFTSTSTPRLARQGNSVDAFWHTDGGATPLPEDGIYTRRIGEADTWHLVAERAEFVVLENADGAGATLVAAATKPGEAGSVRWFLRKRTAWYDLGETDVYETLYTSTNTGTEPFAVWRGETPGTIHAAFNGISRLVVEDLRLPAIP